MTTDEEVARRKLSLLQLASDLNNVSRACKVMVEQIDRALTYEERIGRMDELLPSGWSESVVLELFHRLYFRGESEPLPKLLTREGAAAVST